MDGGENITQHKYCIRCKNSLKNNIHSSDFENPFDGVEKIEWHHITDVYVVALPKEIHRLYSGYKHHREMCIDIVKQIYLGE